MTGSCQVYFIWWFPLGRAGL